MSAIITASIRNGNAIFKTTNIVVENVIRSSIASLAVKDSNGNTVESLQKGVMYFLNMSSSNGLSAGDILRASVVSTSTNGVASEEMNLGNVKFIDGTECVWGFAIPNGWASGLVTLRIQHMNYYERLIGSSYCSVYAK